MAKPSGSSGDRQRAELVDPSDIFSAYAEYGYQLPALASKSDHFGKKSKRYGKVGAAEFQPGVQVGGAAASPEAGRLYRTHTPKSGGLIDAVGCVRHCGGQSEHVRRTRAASRTQPRCENH